MLLVLLVYQLAVIGCGLGGGATATVADQPLLALSTTSITFGNINTGASSTKSFTVSNSGTAALTISGVVLSGTGFSLSGLALPLNIAPGSSVTASIKFAPTASGNATGSISFASNSTTATAPVALSGTGVALTPQLALSVTSIAFGNVATAQSSSHPLTITNTGGASLHVSALTAAGAGYTLSGFILPLTLAPAATASGNVVFAPTTTGTVNGSITVASDSASSVPPIALSGTGVTAAPQITVTPTTLNFGSVITGQTATTPLTLKNSGTATLTVSAITVTGAGYSVNGFIVPMTLSPGGSSTGNVLFAPASASTATGAINISSNSSAPAPTVSLSGTGVATATYLLTASPSSLTFGDVVVGVATTLDVTLANTGTGSISVTSANITGTGYAITATFPIAIAAGTTRVVPVVFTPQVSGPANGSVSFVSNAGNSPATVAMTATGQAPAQHSVDLSWIASTSTVVGYNVYRSTVSGGPYALLNSSPLAATTYTDPTVLSGTTYYYVVRSVSATGAESANSAEASARIP